MSSIPEDSYVRLDDDVTLHYLDIGEGEAVLFIHGSGPGASGYSHFKDNYPLFVQAGYQVVVPDLPGYGLSSKPETDYVLDFFVEAMKGLLEHLAITRVTVVGASLGGAIAIKLALDYPKLVQRLVVMAPDGMMKRDRYLQEMEGVQKMTAAVASDRLSEPEGMRRLLRWQVYDDQGLTEEIVLERLEVSKLQPRCVMSTMKVPNLSKRLHELKCPILGFWGANDQFCPPSGAQVMMEKCRNIRFTLLSECGHWVMIEHKDLFNRQSLEFMEQTRPLPA